MSPKLPVVSGEDLIRALEKFGYIRVRQKGATSGIITRQNRNASQSLSRCTQKSHSAPSNGSCAMRELR